MHAVDGGLQVTLEREPGRHEARLPGAQAPGAVWADPDQADAIAQLRRLADDAAARAALGARAREAATRRLGTESLAAALRSIGLLAP